MAKTKQIPILGSKAIIFRNKYDVWQFRMYVKNARRYVEKSLRVKEQARAEELAEAFSIFSRFKILHPFMKYLVRKFPNQFAAGFTFLLSKRVRE